MVHFVQIDKYLLGNNSHCSRMFVCLADADERTDDAGAMTTAFSALIPNIRSQGRTQVSFGIGHYSGANAVTAGMFHYLGTEPLVPY
ncbi:MAG: hypothetical protein BA874_11895 [Desulfuromonadales bacterium C00003068]|jgi:hypothetical protein|nr:MAG: hypothetical protein BA874_11895 [Desulfuromonadales bacterium C00003068]